MTVYYDPQSPILNALTQCNDTVFKLVLGRAEFWIYMTLHVVMVSLMIYNNVEIEEDAVFQAAQAMQYFMTFFLTFYNANCYARYESLYPACMELMDSLLLFVQEMAISLHHPELQRHRVLSMKYLLASVYLFFMGITGGSIQGKEWSEVVRKGLLTKPEAQMLRSYPGGRVQLVLTSWAMQVITDALMQDCMWKPKSQRIAHVHNRLDVYVVNMVKSYQHISNTMAMPIPFPYYHLMNLILVLNFIMLALLFASLKSWFTLMPFGTALLVFMGLREVSTALSDPFGQDAVDFPIAQYLDYTFDHAVCLLESFSHPDAYLRTIQMINIAKPFSDKQLKRTCNTEILYTKDFRPALDNPYAWNKDKPLKSLDVEECSRGHLKRVISNLPWEVAHANDPPQWSEQHEDYEDDEQSNDSVSTQARINSELKEKLAELQKNLEEIKENQVFQPS
jgi:predicted membrane chloride channel (bestrophin family)